MRKWNKLLSLLLAMIMAFSLAATGLADGEEGEAAAEPVAAYQVPEDAKDAIVILHTNDVHGAIENYAKVAALKTMYEEAGATVYLLDAGDFIQGALEVGDSRGATAFELMTMAGYDAATLGNHEFDYGYENLASVASKATFPILAANVFYDGAPAFDEKYIFTTESGTQIGVFGLDTPEAQTKSHPGKTVGVTFAAGEDMFAIAQAQVDELTKSECDYIICLGHLGIDAESTGNRSIDLLEKVTGIDVFIDGHSHSTLEAIAEVTNENRTVGETVITSTGTALANIGVVTIKGETITTATVSTDSITVAEDDAILARVAAIKAGLVENYDNAKVGTTEVLLNGAKAPGNRTEETNLGDLVCDAILWKVAKEGYEVDAAFTNGGGIRANIDAGDITKRSTFNVLPFFNTLAVAEMTGAQLLEILEASTYCTPEAVGGFPQVAGIAFTVDTTKAFDQGDQYPDSTYYAPKTINRVTIQTVGGEAFDAEATYKIATNDFLAFGGDTCYVLKSLDAAHNKSIEVFLDTALQEYIATELGGVVTAEKYGKPAGRITIVTGEAPAEPAEPTTPAEPSAAFSDVAESNWHYEFVTAMVDAGVVSGYPDGTFLPSNSVKWGEALKMVLSYAKYDEPAKVEGGTWASGWIALAKSEGIIDKDVEQNAVITRVEMCELVAKTLKIAASEAESAFADVDNGYVTALVELKVIEGMPDGTFDPDGELTRAQLCKILFTAPEAPAKEAPAEGEAPAAGEAPAEGENTPTEGEDTPKAA